MMSIKKRFEKNGISITFVFLLFLSGAYGIYAKDVKQSDTENRPLQQLPSWSLSAIQKGTLQSEMTSYLGDQFPFRDTWVKLHANLEHQLGKMKLNGIYIGKNDELFQKSATVDNEVIKQKQAAINLFAKKYPKQHISMLLVPNKATILKEKLPAYVEDQDQMKDIRALASGLEDTIRFTDAFEALRNKKEESLYYRSDHHWTGLGAYTAFLEWKKKELSEEPLLEYEHEAINTSFLGTLANTSGYVQGDMDTIDIYTSPNDPDYIVRYPTEKKTTTTLFDNTKADGNQPYEVFLSGNHPLVEIATTAKNQKHLLLIKDSYANCFVSYLLSYYSTITIVDPRYYFDDLSQLIQEQGITDTLFLYNANTFFTDTSLQDMLNEALQDS